jgi:hypothetical protein
MKSNFQLVSVMNSAFGNPKGNSQSIEWERIRNQCLNIFDEAFELMVALGADPQTIKRINAKVRLNLSFPQDVSPDDVRDALCDVHVFAYGAHHLMGVDADHDMEEVVSKVMTRFIKDPADKVATITKHAAKGVTDVYFEGDYPVMVMKSASNQPDAPKGKFLKSASFKEAKFYSIIPGQQTVSSFLNEEARDLFDKQNAMVKGDTNV